MSSQEFMGSQESSAGAGPAQRSGDGPAPADGPVVMPSVAESANVALSPVPAEDEDQFNADVPVDEEVPSVPIDPEPFGVTPVRLSGRGPRSSRRLVTPQEAAASTRKLSAEQKLLILDTWQRSGLPATDFGGMIGLSKQTLYSWKRRFETLGPAGLDDESRKKLPTGSKLPELTRRTILMLKKANPDWGCQRISDVLYRGPGLPASAGAVARVRDPAK